MNTYRHLLDWLDQHDDQLPHFRANKTTTTTTTRNLASGQMTFRNQNPLSGSQSHSAGQAFICPRCIKIASGAGMDMGTVIDPSHSLKVASRICTSTLYLDVIPPMSTSNNGNTHLTSSSTPASASSTPTSAQTSSDPTSTSTDPAAGSHRRTPRRGPSAHTIRTIGGKPLYPKSSSSPSSTTAESASASARSASASGGTFRPETLQQGKRSPATDYNNHTSSLEGDDDDDGPLYFRLSACSNCARDQRKCHDRTGHVYLLRRRRRLLLGEVDGDLSHLDPVSTEDDDDALAENDELDDVGPPDYDGAESVHVAATRDNVNVSPTSVNDEIRRSKSQHASDAAMAKTKRLTSVHKVTRWNAHRTFPRCEVHDSSTLTLISDHFGSVRPSVGEGLDLDLSVAAQSQSQSTRQSGAGAGAEAEGEAEGEGEGEGEAGAEREDDEDRWEWSRLDIRRTLIVNAEEDCLARQAALLACRGFESEEDGKRLSRGVGVGVERGGGGGLGNGEESDESRKRKRQRVCG